MRKSAQSCTLSRFNISILILNLDKDVSMFFLSFSYLDKKIFRGGIYDDSTIWWNEFIFKKS